ncbi:CAMK family protein kinase [Histomonas meleagridis]|uniref:CAMK family protein kinase n=1 Tax=Histomonas meleagridis TaxID=135588 RepID=UPI00355A7063|nr:CAMK family protein kinase [Histomonas meleagridis]KAH0806607.1 CAMK family protein kinase [Histomonas meleagridis]
MSLVPKQIGNYLVIGSLGSGTSCKVKLAENKETHERFAIKILKKGTLLSKPNLYSKIQREIALMSLLNHPNILKLFEVFESTRHLHIVLEYAENGELFDLVVQHQHLSEPDSMHIFRQIIYALEYLHIHGICHRDLKPENILLDQYDNVKLADFGFARWMKTGVANTSCGSPHYTAPEVIKSQPYSGVQADVWSSGIILYAMLSGKLPFNDVNLRNLLYKISKGDYQNLTDVSSDIQDLISRILIVDPEKRITIPEIKEHPAFRLGLPDGYAIPKPLTLPDVGYPIDPQSIDSKVYQLLKQVGYQDENELNNDLLSDEPTMIKVFYLMLTKQYKEFMIPFKNELENKKVNEVNEQIDGKATMGSVAKKVDWIFNDNGNVIFEIEECICGLKMQCSDAMFVVQKLLKKCECEWFYPNERLIIAMTKSLAVVQFEIVNEDMNEYSMYVKMDGAERSEFNELFDELKKELVNPIC